MNAFLAKPVIGRQLYFDRNDLAYGGKGKLPIDTAPRNENATSTNVFRMHRALRPKSRRRQMAPKLDLDSRALASIDVLHFPASMLCRI
jgi:hypothetical protein